MDVLRPWRKDGNERTDLLHPVLAERVKRLLMSPDFAGFMIESAVRTRAEQRRLYDGWLAKRRGERWARNFNLAANPDRLIGRYGGVTFTGSYHLEQSDGYGYAVDLFAPWTWKVRHPTLASRNRWIDARAKDFGLRRTVASEWWHLQAMVVGSGWYPDPSAPPAPMPSPPPAEPATTMRPMLLRYSYFTFLNEGWRYRQLTSPDSVAAFTAAGVPVVDLSNELSTFKALRREAQAVGRWVEDDNTRTVLERI